MWVDLLKNLDAYTKFTAFSDQVRDLTMASTYKVPKQNLTLGLRVYRLLERYDIRVPDLDAYSILGTYERYTEFNATVSKGLGKHFMADSGFGWRQLDATQTASAFNHGYKHGFLSLTSSDLIHKGLSLTATGNYYHGEDSVFRNNYFGSSFSAAQKLLKKKLTLSAGTDYYLYRFNFATGNEAQNVQTFFARADAKVCKTLRLKTGYEFENSDNGYHTLKFALTKDF